MPWFEKKMREGASSGGGGQTPSHRYPERWSFGPKAKPNRSETSAKLHLRPNILPPPLLQANELKYCSPLEHAKWCPVFSVEPRQGIGAYPG